MPIDYKDYPPNWKTEIVPRIRERSGNKCEWCDVLNGAWIVRLPEGLLGGKRYVYMNGPDDWIHGILPYKIVLTTAHLGTPHADGTPGDKHDKMDVRDENLAHLCQACHLNYDRADHIQHRKENRELRLGILKLDL